MSDSNKSMNMDLPELDRDDVELGEMFEPQLPSPEPEPAPTLALAPERVRFTVPAVLSFDGYEETFDVSVLNLSAQGVALRGPQGLVAHDRLRLQFRLNLAAEPQSFLCEVMWVHNGPEQHATYGLRFVDLDPHVAEQVQQTVRERVEGRAGEWTLPLLPPPSPAATKPAAPSRVPLLLAAALGLCLGAGTTLLAIIGLGFGNESPVASPEPELLHRASDSPEVAPGSEPAVTGDVPLPSAAPALVAPEAPAAKPTTLPPIPAAKPPVVEPPTLPTAKGPSPTRLGPGVKLRKIGLLRVEEAADKVALTLLADGPISHHDVFWLQNPARLVVDIPGRQSGFQSKLFEVGHPLVQRLRVGQHPGKVRFVIETGKNVAPKVQSQHQGNGVRIEFRRTVATAAR